MEVIDIGRLIECIQERTFMWDEKNNHHRDRKARDMAWMEIGDEMFDNWSQLSRTEKAEKEKLIKDKWKHLKDSFSRSIRHGYDNIYADSLYFLRDKNASVENKVQNDGHEANENSTTDSSQNTNGLNNAQSSFSQETSDCSSSISAQKTNGLRKEQPSLSQKTSDCSSSDSNRNAKKLRNVKRSLTQGTSKSSSLDSNQNTNRLRNVQPSLSQETSKKAETNPKEKEDADKSFLDSLLRDYRKLDEDDKLDFRILCLQHIRVARKKRKSQNLTSPVSSSKQRPSQPMQITPD